MPNRGVGFTNKEVTHLLDIIREVLPIEQRSGRRWSDDIVKNLVTESGTRTPWFQALCTKKVPTGDPKIPNSVWLAKDIYNEIKQKADMSEGEDEDAEEEEEEEDNNLDKDSSMHPTNTNTSPGIGSGVPASVSTIQTTRSGTQQHTTPRVANKSNTKTNVPPASVQSFGTPVIHTGTRSQPSDPFEKYIRMMMLQKDQEREERKQKECIREEEARERREEACLQREELRQQNQSSQQIMQMFLFQMMNNNNSNSNNNPIIPMIPISTTLPTQMDQLLNISNALMSSPLHSNNPSIPTVSTIDVPMPKRSSTAYNKGQVKKATTKDESLVLLIDTDEENETTTTKTNCSDEDYIPEASIAKRPRKLLEDFEETDEDVPDDELLDEELLEEDLPVDGKIPSVPSIAEEANDQEETEEIIQNEEV